MKNIIINIHYANELIQISIPESRLAGVLDSELKSAESFDTVFNRALLNPLKAPRLSEFVHEGESLLIIVNDGARHTPTATILKRIGPIFSKADFEFLVATGSHRPPTELELKSIFGPFYQTHRSRISIHDCRNKSELELVGKTSYGTRIIISRRILHNSKILVIGSVEPHYFAGFTGGRKALIPGAAGYETIEQNHSHAMSELSEPMKLNGNPVHEDMEEAVKILDKDIFSIQVVQDIQNRIVAAFAGNIQESMHAAADKARAVYGISVLQKADIVMAVAVPPLDSNLYQAQKAMEHARMILNPGGILILVSACYEGIGPDAFYRLLSAHRNFDAVIEKIQLKYRLGHHKAAKWISLSHQASSLHGVTQLDPRILKAIHMTPFTSVQEAVDLALQKQPGKVWVMPTASVTVPVLQN